MSCNCIKPNSMNIKKLTDTAIVPTRGSASAAGFDLYVDCNQDSIDLMPGETVKLGTGIALEIPEGYVGLVFARSGLATNKGLRPANCVGVIDSDYRGEVIVALHNDSNYIRKTGGGDRIAQLVIVPYLAPELNVVDDLTDTDRGEGGFGSTGK